MIYCPNASPVHYQPRLALGFSKKLECLEWAVTLHMAYFNFCWQPATLADRMTPAMAAGVTNRP